MRLALLSTKFHCLILDPSNFALFLEKMEPKVCKIIYKCAALYYQSTNLMEFIYNSDLCSLKINW